MTNDTLAEISRQTRDRLAEKAQAHLGRLGQLVAGQSGATNLVGSLGALIEMLRDTNSDDVQIGLGGMATLYDLRALEAAEEGDDAEAQLLVECAEAFARRQEQIDAAAFHEPRVERGSIR
ncbi:hypothetical protein LRM64_10185 [Prescottella equi]|uniref:hypothetical protein n=1 Tax=Rhodococcus hoagii TaxID=43767 RepID=UPI0019FDE818|nr:hypothetical protein [Prescottella equi]MBM4592265.1 hypothetical protein [Prescottella equi]MBM4596131.1 hypothetical protein [Prescottella equi]MCU7531915.1 hypothetical protein [Prescottella equi]MCU7534047.1 hypothetical protein [Prescottella equi]NKW12983.1 hypothetical protein [Prescottella equi]